jgi:hypothetical protein
MLLRRQGIDRICTRRPALATSGEGLRRRSTWGGVIPA